MTRWTHTSRVIEYMEIRLAVEELNKQERRLEHQKKLHEKMNESEDRDEDDVEGIWFFFKKIVVKAAEDMCGKRVKREEGEVAVCGGMKR